MISIPATDKDLTRLVRVGSLDPGTCFHTALTDRAGVIIEKHPGEGIAVDLLDPKETKNLAPEVLVSVDEEQF